MLRRSRNDIERTGVTREATAEAVITLRDCPTDASNTISPLFGEAIGADEEEVAAAVATKPFTFAADDAYADAIISST